MDHNIIIAFLAYFSILLTIGLICHKRSRTSADFIMGNRSLSFWLIALSAHASDMSAWLFMSFPMAILIGGSMQLWIAFGVLIGMFLNWHFVAPKLRVATEKYNCYTLSTFFEKRFADNKGTIRLLSAAMMLIFLTHYLSAGLIAMGFLFESIFDVNYYFGLTVATVVVVLYTFIGGFITVAWTDFFQGIFLLLMILIVPIVAFTHIDGISSIVYTAQAQDISLALIPTSLYSIYTAISLILVWGLGYFGMPHIITKFMGIKNAGDLYKSKYLGMSWQLIALGAAASIGFIGIAYFPQGLENPELIFVNMVQDLFHPLAAGFILCGIIAANMSTMDSQILVCASVITEDLYKRLKREKEATPEKLLKVSRFAVILVSVFSLMIALNKSSTILDTVQYAWSGLGSAFGPLVLTSLYSNYVNKNGVIAGILVGGIVAGIWPTLNPLLTDYTIVSMIPGFFLSLASIYLVSALTKKKEAAVTNNLLTSNN